MPRAYAELKTTFYFLPGGTFKEAILFPSVSDKAYHLKEEFIGELSKIV